MYQYRDLSTEIELMLTTSMLPAKCHVVIEETIPRGMYVDPNQLRDLSESQGLQTYVAGTSNTFKSVTHILILNKFNLNKPIISLESLRIL